MELMTETLRPVARSCLLLWILSTVVSAGLQVEFRQVLKPLRSARFVVATLVANCLLMPALTYLILAVLPLSDGFRIGLALTGVAAGAPFLPMLADLAHVDRSTSIALMILLSAATAFYMPLALPFLLPGTDVDPMAIEQSLALVVLLPLAAGLVLRAARQSFALHLGRLLRRIAKIALALALALIVVVGHDKLLGAVGRFGFLAAVVLISGGTGLGFLLGGASWDRRVALGFATGSRNVAAALAVATANFGEDADVPLMCVLVALVMLGLQVPLARWLGSQRPQRSTPRGTDCARTRLGQ